LTEVLRIRIIAFIMSGLGWLPAELLFAVAKYCDTGSLHALSLSCKKLNQIATPHLYRSCDKLLTADRCSQLAITLAARPDLAQLCEVFSFSLRTASKEDVYIFSVNEPVTNEDVTLVEAHRRWRDIQNTHAQLPSSGEQVSDVHREWEPYLPNLLFKLCSNTKHLSLCVCWTDAIFDTSFAQGMPNLERIDFFSKRKGGPSEDGFQEHWVRFEQFTELRHLRALHFYECDVTAIREELLPITTIKELGMHHCDVMAGDLEATFGLVKDLEVFEYSWLAENCTDSMMTSHGTLHFLQAHRNTLRRLRLSLILVDNGVGVANQHVYFFHFAEPTNLATFEVLEHLDIEYIAFLQDPTIDWAAVHLPETLSVPLKKVLPRSIKSIVLRRCLGQVRRHLFDLVAGKDEPVSSWPHLRTIHVVMWNAYTEDSWEVLRRLFAERNIVLTVSAQQPESWEDAGYFQKDLCPYLDEYTEEHEWRMAFEI
jgi:hypothetical protein